MFEWAAMPLFDQLYNFAHWLCGNPTDAEDLVQETYAKALKAFSSFEEGTNLRAWMFRILRNTFLSSRAGIRAWQPISLDEDDDTSIEQVASHNTTPELLLLQQESSQTMIDALAALPVNHREIILLCDVEELRYKEIAQVLAIPVGTVMSRLARARKALRSALTQMPEVTRHGM